MGHGQCDYPNMDEFVAGIGRSAREVARHEEEKKVATQTRTKEGEKMNEKSERKPEGTSGVSPAQRFIVRVEYRSPPNDGDFDDAGTAKAFAREKMLEGAGRRAVGWGTSILTSPTVIAQHYKGARQ